MIDSGTLLQDRFLIEDQIGSGGMGAVYRAIDQKFGSQVAIKETFYGDTELAAAFEREARLLNGLHHPILPHVSDSFTENGGHFLVMEYIEGEDLSELLKRGEVFSVETVVGWAFDLLDGLDYLHSQEPPVIHRDIKPNNLKITSRGRIVLLDFGMAKETSSNTLEAKSVFGYSRRYSPLEQIEGTGTDERSDIFSLGASIYHLMCGTPPADVLARASAIVAGRPDPLIPANLVNPAIPEPVASVLNSALDLNVEQRFGSAGVMSAALEEAVSVSPVSQHKEERNGAIHLGGQPITTASESAPVTVFAQSEIVQGQTPSASESDSSGQPLVDTTAADSRSNTASGAPAGRYDKAFTARSAVENFRDRVRSSLPSAIPVIRIRKPSRLNYALLLPILLFSLGLVLLGSYGLYQRGDKEASSVVTPRVVADSRGAEETATTSQPEETAESNIEFANESQPAPEPPAEDSATNIRKGPIADTTRRSNGESVSEKKIARERASESASTADRRGQKQGSASRRSARRVVRPAFEQPTVSSIEAIMTGERRDRWVYERDPWAEDEMRRRRVRRNRRYQQPF